MTAPAGRPPGVGPAGGAAGRIPPVYAIADADALAPRPLPAAVAEMAAAGVRWIQLRAKRASGADAYRLLDGCLAALAGSGADLWVDDRADLAALLPVAGLHLGQADLPPAAARRVLAAGGAGRPGASCWIGFSTHNDAQVAAAEADPAVDVVAIGPVFPTTGKERPDPVVGLDGVRRARALTAKPLVAIGGIDAGNIAAVLAAGADSAAVISAVCRGDIAENCRRLQVAAGCTSS